MTGFDYSAWAAPIDRTAFDAFVGDAKSAQLQPEPDGPGSSSSQTSVSVGIASGVVGAAMLAVTLVYRAMGGEGFLVAVGLIVAVAGFCGAIYLLIRNGARFAERWRMYYRATWFAGSNGLEYVVRQAVPNYDGMLFHMPSDRHETNYVYVRRDSPVIETGQMCHTYNLRGGRRGSRTRLWGYVVVELSFEVPSRSVLRSNAEHNEAAMSLKFAQKVGDATPLSDSHTLYSPPESAPVSRQLFTPELLGRIGSLETRFGPVNAEVTGNHLYVFSKKPFDLYDATTVRLVFDTIAAALASDVA